MLSEKYLYLPKVLFQTRPEFRAELGGSGGIDTDGSAEIRGECLFYPFSGGSIIITAVNGLPDGFYRLKISGRAFGEKELPSLLSTRGFSYSMVHDGRFTPDSIGNCGILITGADNKTFASGTVK